MLAIPSLVSDGDANELNSLQLLFQVLLTRSLSRAVLKHARVFTRRESPACISKLSGYVRVLQAIQGTSERIRWLSS